MKNLLVLASLAVALAIPSSVSAQATTSAQHPYANNHVELGAYGDLFRVSPANTSAVNYLGIGARVGINVHPNVQLEAEMNYDFERNYTNTFTTRTGTTTTSTTVTSSLRPLTGLFGPKFQVGTSGPIRAFLTAKGGFIRFTYSNNAPSGSTFSSSFNEFGNDSTHFAAYPGGGIEFFAGPLGIRVEAGDEIWVNNGAHNNLRVTFGPTLRF
ncbi:MAG TPA: hypothetical protein VN612_02460 [Acidobacteriaceae bacterium]|nr:hypothetical protein [Acidobacteriaceae bacterium]